MPERPISNPKQMVSNAPVLQVQSPHETARYYRDKLGFTWDYGDDAYSVVYRENAAVHFVHAKEKSTGAKVFFWVQAVDELRDEFVRNDVPITVEIGDRPYGVRDFAIEDINGISLIFGQEIK